MTATAQITRFRLAFIVAGVAVIVSQPGGYDLVVAIVLAVGFASIAALHLARSYAQRDRGLRFGAVTSIVLLSLVWLAIVGVTFYFLYYPESVWRWA